MCTLMLVQILAIPLLPYELLKIKGDIDLYNQNTNSKLQKKEKRNNKKKPGSGKIAAFFGGIKGSISDAINLKAIVIIIASSCAISFPIGLNNLSIPSVNSIGDVVNVKTEVPIIRSINLIAIKNAVLIPDS